MHRRAETCSARALADEKAALEWLTLRRGAFVAANLASMARWVDAGGPEALEEAQAPASSRSVSLPHPEKVKALKAARAMLAIPGKVWDELGVGFSFNAVAPALAALVATLEREPRRSRGRPEAPARFARRMLEFGAGPLAVLGLPQLTGAELAAAAVASGVIPGTRGNERAFVSMLDTWQHHASRQRPKNPEAFAERARATFGAEKLARIRQAIDAAAAA